MKVTRKDQERELVANLRKTRILEEAERLFLARGMHETTITHIAQACEMARGALYTYFGGKDEIAFIIWAKISQGFLEELQSAVAGAPNGQAECRGILETYPRTLLEHRDYHALNAQFNVYFSKSYPDTPLVEDFFRVNKGIAELVESAIRRGSADGSLRRLPDAERTALTLLNVMNGFVEKYALREDLMNREQAVPLASQLDHAVELLLAALEAP